MLLRACLKSTDPEGETGDFPSPTWDPLGRGAGDEDSLSLSLSQRAQRERAVEMMRSTWHFVTTLRLFRHALSIRPTSRGEGKEGRELDRNVLMYLRTGSAGPTQPSPRIVGRRRLQGLRQRSCYSARAPKRLPKTPRPRNAGRIGKRGGKSSTLGMGVRMAGPSHGGRLSSVAR